MPQKTPPSREVPKLALVDLLARASSAAHIVGRLEDCDGSTAVEQLADHIDALVHGLCELVGEHRRAGELAPGNGEHRRAGAMAPGDGEMDAFGELRQCMARADALAWTTDEQFSRVVVLADGANRPGFARLAHLIEMTALAVSSAADASAKLIATLERDVSQERA